MSGLLLMLLGAWGAIVPFVGHYWGYGFTPNDTWHWTAARWWLEVLPGIGAFVAGLLISTTANRMTAMVAGWLGMASGAWFVLGTTFSSMWSPGNIGLPDGNPTLVVWERVGMFAGLGVAIVALSAFALGRFSVVAWADRVVREEEAEAAPVEAGEAYNEPGRAYNPVGRRIDTTAPATVSAEPTTKSTRVWSGLRRSIVRAVMRAPTMIENAKKRSPMISQSAWKDPMPSPMRSNQPSVRTASRSKSRCLASVIRRVLPP